MPIQIQCLRRFQFVLHEHVFAIEQRNPPLRAGQSAAIRFAQIGDGVSSRWCGIECDDRRLGGAADGRGSSRAEARGGSGPEKDGGAAGGQLGTLVAPSMAGEAVSSRCPGASATLAAARTREHP